MQQLSRELQHCLLQLQEDTAVMCSILNYFLGIVPWIQVGVKYSKSKSKRLFERLAWMQQLSRELQRCLPQPQEDIAVMSRDLQHCLPQLQQDIAVVYSILNYFLGIVPWIQVGVKV